MDIVAQVLAQTMANAEREFAAGRLPQAGRLCQQVLSANPRHFRAAFLLGVVAVETGRVKAGVAILEQAARLEPNAVEPRAKLAEVLRAQGAYERAIEWLKQALALRPLDAQLHSNMGMLLGESGRMAESQAAQEKAHRLAPEDAQLHSNALFGSHLLADATPASLLAAHAAFGVRHDKSDAEARAADMRRTVNCDAERPLRVGYLSAHFQSHPVALFIEPLISHHRRERVIPYCYSNTPMADDITLRIKRVAAEWREVCKLSDDDLLALITRDQIDILVDLAGHTADHRLTLFGRRAAPIQMTYLGYPGTTGMRTMDYRLTDGHIDPPGAEAYYTEKLVRLPETFAAYLPQVDIPAAGPPLVENGHVTLGCFASVSKLGAPLVAAWVDILRQLPTAKLMLTAPGMQEIAALDGVRAALATGGVTEDRLVLRPRGSVDDYLRMHAKIDICLDTFPISGHTVLCRAAWMGVPFVCLTGDRAWTRLGTSVLRNLGLPELAATSVDGYVQTVVALARDTARLVELRSTMRQRMQASPIMDYPRFAGHVEAAYRQMWHTWIGF